jgi:3-hydroxybutyryl-CoA dehydrogenase
MIAEPVIGVLGCGQMGSGIAQVAATAGLQVVIRDTMGGQLEKGRDAIQRSTGKLIEKGKLAAADREAALARISYSTELNDLSRCDLVIEAVTEDLLLKNELWQALDRHCPERTIFASNTSSLSIAAMAAATTRPDRFAGLHFFNPVPLLALVEVVRGVGTSQDTIDQLFAFARRIGKEPVAARDSSGFIVNLLLVPYILDGIRALERGVATARDLDTAMKLGASHPMGPLELADFVGLDTLARIGDIMFDEYRETRYAAPPLLRRMVLAGLHGRKSGRGFYDYGVNPPVPTNLGLA